MTPPPKPCTASESSRSSKTLCSMSTSGEEARMHIGEAQCWNVEFLITTPSASGVSQIAAPAPPAPPSRCRSLNVTSLEVATLTYAVAAAGAIVSPVISRRADPVMFMPAIVAPGSPASVMSARAATETVVYAPGASWMTSPGSASARAVANSASLVTRTIVAPAAAGANSATPTARPETAVFAHSFKIGDRNKLGPSQEHHSTPTKRQFQDTNWTKHCALLDAVQTHWACSRDLRPGGSRWLRAGGPGGSAALAAEHEHLPSGRAQTREPGVGPSLEAFVHANRRRLGEQRPGTEREAPEPEARLAHLLQPCRLEPALVLTPGVVARIPRVASPTTGGAPHRALGGLDHRIESRIEHAVELAPVVHARDDVTAGARHACHLAHAPAGAFDPRQHAERDHEIDRPVRGVQRVHIALAEPDPRAQAVAGDSLRRLLDHAVAAVDAGHEQPALRKGDRGPPRSEPDLQHARVDR